jgi:integrase
MNDPIAIRSPRVGVTDLWYHSRRRDAQGRKAKTKLYGKGRRWQTRWVGPDGVERTAAFDYKADAECKAKEVRAALAAGKSTDANANLTVAAWCEVWLKGYAGSHRRRSVAVVRSIIGQIVAEFGELPLQAVRPSHVKAWTAGLAANGYAAHTVHRWHAMLRQVLEDAVYDDKLAANPCSQRTSPPMGKSKDYVLTTEQVWALHDAMPDRLKVAVLLGAFAGLTTGEVCGLRVSDVDFMRGVVKPQRLYTKKRYGEEPLKTPTRATVVPIPRELALMLAASVQRYGGETVVTNERGGRCAQSTLEKAVRTARDAVDLPGRFVFHDLRHYYGSALTAAGEDIYTVQKRMRHARPSTTMDVYGHQMRPDAADEQTRTHVSAIISGRAENVEADGPA